MNISKLNPIGYEAKTVKGNTYKKSNIAKTTALATGIGLTALTNMSTNPIVKAFSTKALLKDLGVKNPKLMTGLAIGAITLDIACYYLFGSWIDKYINSKREIEADKV